MTKLFTENGFLTDDGKKAMKPISNELTSLISSGDLGESEVRTLGSNLLKLISDSICSKLQELRGKAL